MSSPSAGLSQDPADILIRELISSGRRATGHEAQVIRGRLASAPFNPEPRRIRPRVGRQLGLSGPAGTVVDSLAYHVALRVDVDLQWSLGTTAEQYLAELHAISHQPTSRLALYVSRQQNYAAAVVETVDVLPLERRGPAWLPLLVAIYSADWGVVVSGYQASSLATIRLGPMPLWLS